MGMRFSVLASGSTGNALYIATNRQRLLVDCGLSAKKTEELLRQVDCEPDQLDAILISHEHSDHVKGLRVFARRHGLPIYANEKTWRAMENMTADISGEQKFALKRGCVKTFGDIDVETFGVSHDAADPMFFSFHHEGKKLALVTDLGYVSERIKGTVKGADALVFEANHDMNMLMMGRYPWNVKRRILGDYGHISNEDAAYALSDIVGDRTKRIYLAHLSRDNNMKDLARLSVQQQLESRGIAVGEAVALCDTDPDVPTRLTVV